MKLLPIGRTLWPVDSDHTEGGTASHCNYLTEGWKSLDNRSFLSMTRFGRQHFYPHHKSTSYQRCNTLYNHHGFETR